MSIKILSDLKRIWRRKKAGFLSAVLNERDLKRYIRDASDAFSESLGQLRLFSKTRSYL